MPRRTTILALARSIDPLRAEAFAGRLAGALPPLLQVGAVVASDQRLDDPRLEPLPLPAGLRDGRYFLYVRVATMMGEP